MICAIEDLMRDVRVALDRNNVSDSFLAEDDIETLSLNDIIRSKIIEATRRVHSEAPTYMLESGHNFGDAVFWDSHCSGHVLLPDDFMRLVVFRMSDWERAVYNAISCDDPQYELQSSRFKGLRGTAQKPVCAIAMRPEGMALEFYSCKSEEAYVKEGLYIPIPKIDESGGIDISERCKESIVYMACALVCISLSEIDKSNSFFELSKTLLQ